MLLVEDNLGDVLLVREAIEEANVLARLHVVRDGVEAIQWLNSQNDFTKSDRQQVIILDLNMPRKNGREVLKEIARTPSLAHIPIAVFTTSQSECDICDEFPSLRSRFFLKQVEFDRTVETVKQIGKFAFSG